MESSVANEGPAALPSASKGAQGFLRIHLTRAHLVMFTVLLVIFTALTFLIVNAGLDDGPEHGSRVLMTALGTISGPFTGAISRGFQGCCLRFSLLAAAYCAPFLLVGVGLQFVRMPNWRWPPVARLALWTLGWLVWFTGGIASFGHALS